MTIVTVVLTAPRFPEPHERYSAAQQALQELAQAWRQQIDEPLPDKFTVIVARPGEIGPSEMHRTHRADEGAALAEASGQGAIAFHMSDESVPEDLQAMVALEAHGGGS